MILTPDQARLLVATPESERLERKRAFSDAESIRDLRVLQRHARIVSARLHVEIRNPGGLHGEVTPEKFGTATAYRNEVLAEAMKAFGYVHKFGSGIPTVHRTLKANANPPAEFDLVPPGFGVNVYPRKDGA